jgi:hypothetical protein
MAISMTQLNHLYPSNNVQAAYIQIQEEVAKIENVLVKLQQKKQEVLQNQLNVCNLNLTNSATNINTLSGQLEHELVNFKHCISEFEIICNSIQSMPGMLTQKTMQNPIDQFLMDPKACKFVPIYISIPIVVKNETHFVLMTKSIELDNNENQDQKTQELNFSLQR